MKLSVSKRNQLIQEIDLGKDVLAHDYSETIFLIGRSKDCHVMLDDKKISREHARVIHKNGKWFIEKTSPANACQINGDDFDRQELEAGDVFTAEGFSVVFDSPSHVEVYETLKSPVETAIAATPAKSLVSEQPIIKVTAKSNATATDLNISQIKSAEPETDSEEGEFDPNSTREIGINELPQASAAESDVEFQDEPLDDLDGFGIDTHQNNDEDLSSLASQETDADIVIAENNYDTPLEDENMSYSLENIDNSSDDESTKVMQSFASIYLELFGDTAPYDRYIVENEKTFIGRDPSKCQIVLNDTEVSTVHAVLTKNNIMVTLEDLNSSNGTLFKGDRINKVILGHNDEFVIGGVTFTLKIRSEFLKDESSTLMAVDENQTVEVEEVVEVEAEEGEQFDALGEAVSSEPQEKSLLKRIWKDEEKRKKLIYAIVVLVGLYVFFGEEEKPAVPVKKITKTAKTIPTVKTSQKNLTEEQKRSFSALYEIGKDHYQNGRYREALNELQKIAAVDPNFNSSLQSLISLSKEGLSKIEEEEKKRQAEILSAERKVKVKELIETAREYTKDRRVDLANKTFNEIAQLEPENLEVTRMKLELEDWQREKQRKELEEATKKKEREDKVEKLKPGRTLYLQKEWFKSISKLEDFLRIKDMDDDLTTEATEMLKVSREELNSAVAPLIGKAKSLLEGQDLKGAYEVYQQILRIEPSNTESLNQVGEIREQLSNRARKIYREAIIAESLSLFQDAKEKYQEVQQISPVDSDYYKKASEKLRDYLE